MMALAETHMALGEKDAAIARWRSVLANNSYARAKVQLAQLLIERGQTDEAKRELDETLTDDAHAPAFQRKRERVWTQRAKALRGALK
ncbi:MAG: tetratricopeptide repeat protein [Verrucomicrobiae bacterium]|nr:tetratricopeptide repeat protein [Verrucomicrobiae bacterium]